MSILLETNQFLYHHRLVKQHQLTKKHVLSNWMAQKIKVQVQRP